MRFKTLDDLKATKAGQLPQNAHVFALDTPKAPKRESPTLSTLVKDKRGVTGRKTSVGFCVTIVSFCRRRMDENNLSSGTGKNLQDAIATSFGIDDADPRFMWEWRQVITDGEEGTFVTVSAVPNKTVANAKTISQGASQAARVR